MLKKSKIRILENFYGIDYVLLGKKIQETKVCCPFFVEEYLSTKGALVSSLVEMYKIIEHSPKGNSKVISEAELIKNAKNSAKVARENAKIELGSENIKNNLKKNIRESLSNTKDKKNNLDENIHREIRRKAFSLALDSMLVKRVLGESKSLKNLNEWEGKVVKEAYKTLRDALVESALNILENSSE